MVSEANGIYQSGEAGLNNISVSLLNTATNKYEQTVTTATINGVAGSYVLTKAKPGNSYKVVFQFNGQKYRAFDSVINGGNQAVSTSFPAITIKTAAHILRPMFFLQRKTATQAHRQAHISTPMLQQTLHIHLRQIM